MVQEGAGLSMTRQCDLLSFIDFKGFILLSPCWINRDGLEVAREAG